MIKRKVHEAMNNRKGMTLVEVIVSFAIVAIAALIMASAFVAALAIVRRSTSHAQADQAAYGRLEQATDGAQGLAPNAEVYMTAGGKTITVKGRYIVEAAEEDGEEVEYSSFESMEAGTAG